MIPEREREALARLTMCARRQCIICKFHTPRGEIDCMDRITENMHILAKALEVSDEQES